MRKWPQKKLGEVAYVIRGVSFDKQDASDTPQQGYLPILRAGNIGDDLDTDRDLIWVSQKYVSEKQLLRLGDVTICMSSGSPQVVGKIAQLDKEWCGSVGAFCAIVRFRDISPRFGALFLSSPAFIAWRDGQAKGANIQNLRKTELEHLNIPVPLPAEQERIVSILDVADRLRKYRAEADRRTNTLIPALFHEIFGSAEDAAKWQTVFAKEVFRRIGYGVGSPPPFSESGLIFLRANNIKPTGISLQSVAHFSAEHAPMIARSRVETGDVVIVRRGANTGDSAVITTELNGAYVGYDLILRPDPNRLLGDWFVTWFNTAPVRSLVRQIRERAAQQGLNAEQIGSRRFPLPPIELQNDFCSKLQQIRTFSSDQASSGQRIDDLFRSLLHRAFQGDL